MGSIPARSNPATAFGELPPFQPLNDDDIRSYLHKAVDFISDYYTNVESMPVLPNVKPPARRAQRVPANLLCTVRCHHEGAQDLRCPWHDALG